MQESVSPFSAHAMPQTLLAISAIIIAGFLTLSQSEVSRRTTEAVITDQFELAVAGTLLHTMEFVDSRAFDEATTPQKLIARLGLKGKRMTAAERDTISFDDLLLIQTDHLSLPSSFGEGQCDIEAPPSTCDDIDDIADGVWRAVDLKTPEGDPLPVEVKVDVVYVKAGADDEIDTPVGGSERTFHKRVEVIARSNVIKTPGGGTRPIQVALRRVISFDPEVAAEYLRREIALDGAGLTCEAEVGSWNTRAGELRDALAAAQEADRGAALAVAGAERDRDAARQLADQADARLATVGTAYETAQAAAATKQEAAQQASDARDAAVTATTRANEAREAAQATSEAATAAVEPARETARRKKVAYDDALRGATDAIKDFQEIDLEFQPLLAMYTLPGDGPNGDEPANRRFKYWVSAEKRQEIYALGVEWYGARDEARSAITVHNKAKAESEAADLKKTNAEAAADNERAAYAAARTAAEAAAEALAGAEAEAQTAKSAATKANTDRDTAAQTLATAQAAADTAHGAADAAQGPVDDAREAAGSASVAASAAAQALRDHEATRPQCSAS